MGAECLDQGLLWVVPQLHSPHRLNHRQGLQAQTPQIASLCHHQACLCHLHLIPHKQHQKIKGLSNDTLVRHHRDKLNQTIPVPPQLLPTLAIIVVATAVTTTVITIIIVIIIIVIILVIIITTVAAAPAATTTTIAMVVRMAQKHHQWTPDSQCHHPRLPACAVVQLRRAVQTCLGSQELRLYSLAEQ